MKFGDEIQAENVDLQSLLNRSVVLGSADGDRILVELFVEIGWEMRFGRQLHT